MIAPKKSANRSLVVKQIKKIMSTENKNQKKDITPQKEGFFTRIFTKIDNSMKVKADEAAKNQCCGDDNDSKGGKCC